MTPPTSHVTPPVRSLAGKLATAAIVLTGAAAYFFLHAYPTQLVVERSARRNPRRIRNDALDIRWFESPAERDSCLEGAD